MNHSQYSSSAKSSFVLSTHILLADQDLHSAAFGNDLGNVVELDSLVALLVWLYAQILNHFGIEAATSSQFRQIVLQPFQSARDVAFQPRKVVRILGCGSRSIILSLGVGFLLFSGCLTSFLAQTRRSRK